MGRSLGYLIILKQSQDRSRYQNIRTPGRVLATGLQVQAPVLRQALVQGPVQGGVQRRVQRRVPGPVPTPEPAPTAVSTEGVRLLEERRQTLQRAAQTLSERGIEVKDFERLGRDARELDTTVVRVLALERTLFPDLAGALEVLQNCAAGLAAERHMTQQRVQALGNCRAGARLVAEAISAPLRLQEQLVPWGNYSPHTGNKG
jgi:hypothetical protein